MINGILTGIGGGILWNVSRFLKNNAVRTKNLNRTTAALQNANDAQSGGHCGKKRALKLKGVCANAVNVKRQ